MLKRKGAGTKHFKDAAFLKELGQHCQRLRSQKGYSIDRLSKESEQLSPSVIHRLESGSGAVTVSALYRYANALGIEPKLLLDFSAGAGKTAAGKKTKLKILEPNHPRVRKEAFKTLLPLYSLKAAAGYFGHGEDVQIEGWIEIKSGAALDKQMFVARAVGSSMSPKINDGDYIVLRSNPVGSRQGKIVLVQYRGPADPETGGSYTIKQYQSSKVASPDSGWKHQQIMLVPLNAEYEPILLLPKQEEDFRVLAEYIFTI